MDEDIDDAILVEKSQLVITYITQRLLVQLPINIFYILHPDEARRTMSFKTKPPVGGGDRQVLSKAAHSRSWAFKWKIKTFINFATQRIVIV